MDQGGQIKRGTIMLGLDHTLKAMAFARHSKKLRDRGELNRYICNYL